MIHFEFKKIVCLDHFFFWARTAPLSRSRRVYPGHGFSANWLPALGRNAPAARKCGVGFEQLCSPGGLDVLWKNDIRIEPAFM